MTKCCQFVEFKCVWHQLAEYLSWNLNCCAQSLGFKVSVAQEEELLTQYCLSLHWGSKVAKLLSLVEIWTYIGVLALNLSWLLSTSSWNIGWNLKFLNYIWEWEILVACSKSCLENLMQIFVHAWKLTMCQIQGSKLSNSQSPYCYKCS